MDIPEFGSSGWSVSNDLIVVILHFVAAIASCLLFIFRDRRR